VTVDRDRATAYGRCVAADRPGAVLAGIERCALQICYRTTYLASLTLENSIFQVAADSQSLDHLLWISSLTGYQGQSWKLVQQ